MTVMCLYAEHTWNRVHILVAAMSWKGLNVDKGKISALNTHGTASHCEKKTKPSVFMPLCFTVCVENISARHSSFTN